MAPWRPFTGSFSGTGFNTIFRPDSTKSPTTLPVAPTDKVGGQPVTDNILELNLTSETLSFSGSLGSVPNRGTGTQADIFLNGVPYLQAISDISTGPIHLEPGLWVIVPKTTIPAEGITLARMGSIPHGVTFVAQGTSAVIAGPPTIPAVSITPTITLSGISVPFPSQTVANLTTHRIPQNLTGVAITQAMLTDPNTFIRNQIKGQKITSTTTISIATQPPAPLFGDGDPIKSTSDGGSANIAFLLGDNVTPPTAPNAQNLRLTATFWIETVQTTITVPIIKAGSPALLIKGTPTAPGQPVPTFSVTSKAGTTAPKTITETYTQIQYSQSVFLNFNTLTWPHVSVATLVPASPIAVSV